MQGASPLASPGLDGARHGLNLRSRHPAGAYPRRWRLNQPLRCLTGACLLCRLPTLPLVYFVSPIPPPRARRALFPGGKGEIFSLFRRGLRPRHPGTYLLTALTDHAEQVSCAREPAVQRSGREISCLKNVPPGFSSGDARGEAPCMKKLWAPPFPLGRGAGGMGAEKQANREAGTRQAKQSPARVPVWQVGRRQRSKCRRREIYASGCCKKAPDVVY